MCGIGGIWRREGGHARADEAELLRIREAMVSRGPDGAGTWISESRCIGLVHRRLAIIDLSHAAAQPMISADGSAVITFNGEIYNYRELRAELIAQGTVFRSLSDTEVLLHLYARDGLGMFKKLRGMFAFAIWDEKRQGLLLARDHFGIKPLYYSDNGRQVVFASQVKALLRCPGVDLRPDPAAHVSFFLLGYASAPNTFYAGIKALEAGTALWVDAAGSRKTERFFSVGGELSAAEPLVLSREVLQERLRGVLEDSVRAHLVSDVPVGMFLSAGVDSVTISSLAVAHTRDLRALTVGFTEFQGTDFDETVVASRIAALLGLHHERVAIERKPEKIQQELETIFAAMDQPTIDGLNTFMVSRAARQSSLKVALSGLGGDELFSGYPLFRQIPKLLAIKQGLPGSMATEGLLKLISGSAIAKLMPPRFRGLLEGMRDEVDAYLVFRGVVMPWELPEVMDPDLAREGWSSFSPKIALHNTIENLKTTTSRLIALELSWYLRNQLLVSTDWASMAHSVEVRVPYVDVDLFRTLAPLLCSERPPVKADVRELPSPGLAALLQKKKTGFNVPVGEWLASMGRPRPSRRLEYRAWARYVYERSGVAP
jgi:asparagine synthase (glutamine-hydrolysing)